MPGCEETCIARYSREVKASEARVWENVLDWEHLPWLHGGTFAAIESRSAGASGWRAAVRLRARPEEPVEIELRAERAARRYVTRTLGGPGAGSEIWTRVEPRAPRCTAIEVHFHVPGITRAAAAGLGRAYVELYTRLWDEDEAMMRHRQAVLDARRRRPRRAAAPTPLGSLAALRARLPQVVSHGGERFRVLELEGRLLAHAIECPHWGGPLDEAPVEAGCITCPWHGYRFELRSGASADGRGLHLPNAPRVEVDPVRREVFLVSDP